MAGDFIGSLIETAGNLYTNAQNVEAQKQAAEAAQDWAHNRIHYTVEDAKRSGLHPLFALSGGTSTYSPAPIVTDFSKAGQSLGRAVSAAMSADSVGELEKLQRRQLQSQIDLNDANAAAVRSQTALREQANQVNAVVPFGTYSYPVSDNQAGIISREEMNLPHFGGTSRGRYVMDRARSGKQPTGAHDFSFDAAKVGTSREFDPAYSAGPPRPFFEEYRVGSRPYNPNEGEHGADRGLYVALPAGGNASEAIEAIAEGGGKSPTSMAIYAENVRRYGKDYVDALGAYLRPRLADVKRDLVDEISSRASAVWEATGGASYRKFRDTVMRDAKRRREQLYWR